MSEDRRLNQDKVIELRSGGKLHGLFDPACMTLEVRRYGCVTVYDLRASAAAGEAVAERKPSSCPIES